LFFILLVDENAGNEPISEELKQCAMSAQKIETMKQKVQTRRAALDFDLSFCKAGVCLIDDFDYSSVIAGSEEKKSILMSTINYT